MSGGLVVVLMLAMLVVVVVAKTAPWSRSKARLSSNAWGNIRHAGCRVSHSGSVYSTSSIQTFAQRNCHRYSGADLYHAR